VAQILPSLSRPLRQLRQLTGSIQTPPRTQEKNLSNHATEAATSVSEDPVSTHQSPAPSIGYSPRSIAIF